MVGMFVSTLPYCTQIDPHWSFDELVKYVREKCLSILEHSHYPLQSILADLHLNQSKVAFLEIMFDFITISSNIDQLSFDGARFEQISLKQSSEAAKFDFKLTFIYNPALDDNKLSFRLACSRDLFDETTVTNISQRFKYLFEQLFSSNSIGSRIDTDLTPISKLDLILPEESKEIEDVVFCRQPNIVNEGMSIFSKTKFLMLDVRRLYQSKI
jgi:non-ribosomal peptide synthetase component F